MRVLIVEDDKDYSKYLSTLFRQYAAEVLNANDAYIALGILENTKIDLIVSDIVLPKLGGLELAKKLDHKFPIYLITGMYKGPLFIDMEKYADAVYFKDEIDKYLIRDIVKLFSREAA